jgi:hypothetical protein
VQELVMIPHLQTAAGTGGRVCARRFAAAAAVLVILARPAAALPLQDPAVTVSESGGVYTVNAAFSAAEAPSAALAALTDYAEIPRFMPEVRTSLVLERTGSGAVVEQEAIARFLMFSKRIHLVLEVQLKNGTIRFRDRCGKSFARYEGSWVVAGREGRTHITYELTAKPSFEVPEFLLKRLLKRDAGRMIERLRKEIAARSLGVPDGTGSR